jgi:predicted NAD/FAD-binding protein
MPRDLAVGPAQNIAVIGSGIAGMSCAWLLSTTHRVTIYEREARIGGHSNTVDAPMVSGPVPVDTGFIVYNETNYPNLTALFRHLGIPTKASEMSFAASLYDGGLEYAGTDLNGLFSQRSNLVRPRFWRMATDLLRFYREAPAFLSSPGCEAVSLGEYLAANGYSDTFIRDHLLPIGAAIWSTTAPEMRAYPAAAFIRFFVSHGLLRLTGRPQWRTVDGGSREYVRRLTSSFADRIRFGGVTAVHTHAGGVEVRDRAGHSQNFDHVVFATHADEALSLIKEPSEQETSLLGPWRYTANRAVLHSDPALMPRRRRVWSSWNFIGGTEQQLCVTYWMNRLQSLDPANPLFVTLNPAREPAAKSVIAEFSYTHPFFDRAALATQKRLWTLQGQRRLWFCGSYFGFGFHEDALQSGLAVAEALTGLRRPWQVEGENSRIHITLPEVVRT